MQFIAQAPTPTPTPGPWATLTPYPTGQATIPGIDESLFVGVAETAVQGYQSIAQYPVFSMIQYGMLLILVIMGVRSIIRRLQDL